jgi:flagellar basal-body rod protein FlgF
MLSRDVALSMQTAIQRDVDVVTHNIANLQTAGFKTKLMVFNEAAVKKSAAQDYSFVQDLATIRDNTPGSFKNTGDQYHAYIAGPGYFAVQTPGGIRYTRNGAFVRDANNQITTVEGYPVMDVNNGPIAVPDDVSQISLGHDGTYSDGTLFSTDQAPIQNTNAKVLQRGFEASNVNSVAETTKLMSLLRSFQQVQNYLEQHSKLESSMSQQLIKIAPAA